MVRVGIEMVTKYFYNLLSICHNFVIVYTEVVPNIFW